MSRGLLILAVSGSMAVEARNDEQLAKIRGIAKTLIQSKDAGSVSAYREYLTISQVDGCSGPMRNSVRHKVHRNGMIESWNYRSPAQSGQPIGYYRGRIDDAQWRALVRMIAGMEWTDSPVGVGGPPHPPGPTESISTIILSDGKSKAGYQTSGPAPGPVSDAIEQPGVLAQGPMDTIWQLALTNPKAVIRKDSVHFTAEWSWRGPPGSRILFSQDAGGEFCGTARFKWYLDTATYTVAWHESAAMALKGRGSIWELNASKPSVLRLSFPYDGPKVKVKAKRVGVLDGIGIRLMVGGIGDTVSATVFTDHFNF